MRSHRTQPTCARRRAEARAGQWVLSSASPNAPHWLRRLITTLRNIAPRAEEGPENAPIPGRGLACLTAREPSSTLPLDEKGRLKFLFLYSLLPIVRNTHSGLTSIPSSLQESARALGLPSFARLRLIELPLAAPSIVAGIKTSAVISVGTATIAAFIGAGGYGERIVAGLAVNDNAVLLAGAIPAAALALLIEGGFVLLDRWLIPAGLRHAKSP